MKKIYKILLCIITISILTACSNNSNIENILQHNDYKKKNYNSGFTTYTKGNFLISIFDKEHKSTLAYEGESEITITTTSDNFDIYSTYDCKYDFSKDISDGNCNDNIISEIKQAKKEISNELKNMNLTFNDFQK